MELPAAPTKSDSGTRDCEKTGITRQAAILVFRTKALRTAEDLLLFSFD